MKKFCLYIFTLMILTGCSTDNEEHLIKEDYYVNFNNGISYDQTIEMSRAGIFDGTFIPKDEVIGIYGFKSKWQNEKNPNNVIVNEDWVTKDIQTNCDNAPYVSLGQSKVMESKNNTLIKFPTNDNAALCFYGYYPYQTDENIVLGTSDKGPKIKLNINPEMEQTTEYLYTGNVPVVPSDRTTEVSLPFKHALSCLSFHIFTKDNKYVEGNCPIIKKITVKTINSQSGYMYIKNGEIEKTNENNKEFAFITDFEVDVNETTKKTVANFLFIPTYTDDNDSRGNAIQEIILTVLEPNSIETKDYTIYKYDGIGLNAIALKKGAKHIVSIEYNVRITVTNSVENWTGGNNYELETN